MISAAREDRSLNFALNLQTVYSWSQEILFSSSCKSSWSQHRYQMTLESYLHLKTYIFISRSRGLIPSRNRGLLLNINFSNHWPLITYYYNYDTLLLIVTVPLYSGKGWLCTYHIAQNIAQIAKCWTLHCTAIWSVPGSAWLEPGLQVVGLFLVKMSLFLAKNSRKLI